MSIIKFPPKKINVDGFECELWDFELNINRKVWRSLTFGQQKAITEALSDLKDALHGSISVCYEEILFKMEKEAAEKKARVNAENEPPDIRGAKKKTRTTNSHSEEDGHQF